MVYHMDMNNKAEYPPIQVVYSSFERRIQIKKLLFPSPQTVSALGLVLPVIVIHSKKSKKLESKVIYDPYCRLGKLRGLEGYRDRSCRLEDTYHSNQHLGSLPGRFFLEATNKDFYMDIQHSMEVRMARAVISKR